MSIYVKNKDAGAELVRPISKKKNKNANRKKIPLDIRVISFCYFCQSKGLLHRCRDEAYGHKRYVILPNDAIQLVCDNHCDDIPSNKKMGFLPDSVSVTAIIAKTSH